jgi:hypothetical protein
MTRDQQLVVALRQFISEASILSSGGEYMRSAHDNHPIALDVWHAMEAVRKLTARERK